MSERDQLTVRRILKVNHAGEYGAIRIYRAQLWLARRRYPDMVPFLEETLGHEIEHCALFRDAMPERGAKPCRVLAFWGNGGLILGLTTALLGRQGIWICTEAVEATVHRHLDEQLLFLQSRDAELHSLIAGIQQEELHHLHQATERITSRSLWVRLLRATVSTATEAVIWLSTWGESTRMARDLIVAQSSEHNNANGREIKTMEAGEEHLSTRRMGRGLTAAAVAGLIAYIAILLGSQAVMFTVAEFAFGSRVANPAFFSRAVLYLIFGLPIALILSRAVGYPIWKRAEARTLRSRRNALAVGAMTGAAIGLLLLAFNILLFVVFGSAYSTGVKEDWQRTLFELLFEFYNILCFTAAGAIAGLAARCVALPEDWKRQGQPIAR
jgi:ubiquinone biosynthesis monooxygenase Coq7